MSNKFYNVVFCYFIVNIHDDKKMDNKIKDKIHWTGVKYGVLGLALGMGIGASIHHFGWKTIPNKEQVQSGFIAPSRLEVRLEEDIDGEDQTILTVDSKPHLLREIDGLPKLVRYSIDEPDK